MAENKRTSALPDAANLTGLERISVVQDGTSKRTTLQAIIDLVSDTAGTPPEVCGAQVLERLVIAPALTVIIT